MNFVVKNNRILLDGEGGVLTTDNVESIVCHFTFDTEDVMEQFALFYRNADLHATCKIIDGQCTIPWQVLQTPGLLYVGAYCEKAEGETVEKKVATNFVALQIHSSLSQDVTDSIAPSPEIWEIYRAEVLALKNSAESAAEQAKSAALQASQSAESAAGSLKSIQGLYENLEILEETVADLEESARQNSVKAALSESTAALHKSNAAASAESAETYASAASESATQAQTEAENAAESAAEAETAADRAEAAATEVEQQIAYTKNECDARYANAVLGEAEGDTAELTDAWAGGVLSRCEIFGETTETGTGDKAPDNPYTLSGTVPTKINVNSENPSTAEGTPVTIELPAIEPLYSAGETAKDSFDAVSGNIVRRTKKVVLSRAGQSGITYYSNAGNPNGDTAYFAYRSGFENAKGGCDFICSHFPRAAGGDALWATDAVASNMSNASFRFRLPKSEMPTWDDGLSDTNKVNLMLTWLDSHPVTVVYELPEPEEEEETGTDIRINSSPAYVYADQGGVGVTYTKDTNAVLAQLADRIATLENELTK